MINCSLDSLVINFSGEQLEKAVRESLLRTSRAILQIHGRTVADLNQSVDHYPTQTAFSRVTEGETLAAPPGSFDKAYVNLAYALSMRHWTKKLGRDEYHSLTLANPDGPLGYMAMRAQALRSGLRTSLVTLHSTGAITLPAGFSWPTHLDTKRKQLEIGHLVGNELLAFIRMLAFQNDTLIDPAFSSIGTDSKRKEWFLTHGTKLLLATGWQTPNDASVGDLEAIKRAEKEAGRETLQSAYKTLVDVFERKYGARFPITGSDWARHARSYMLAKNRGLITATSATEAEQIGLRSDIDVLADVVKLTPISAHPESVLDRKTLPGLAIELEAIAGKWIELEKLYLRRMSRENYDSIRQSLGYLNIYLFHYLPFWFQRNSEAPFQYPASPSQLISGIFVSRIVEVKFEVPKTLTEVLQLIAESREWKNTNHYGILKQIEGFFSFIERNSLELDGCAGFKQPLTSYDFPATSRAYGTTKSPIPRRLFNVFLNYTEALRSYSYRIIDGIVDGSIDGNKLEARTKLYATTIDAFALSDLVGFVPLIFARGKTIPLQFIPNVLDFHLWKLARGPITALPQPHALNQIIVALHTGLRHNHVQWLDERTFDCKVDPGDQHYSLLLVNTDKSTKATWTPYVNMRVIEILRSQRSWRMLIDEPNFASLHFYDGNPQTKWEKLVPLFASDTTGRPHPDSRYYRTWKDILGAVQGILSELGENSVRLCSLEPPNIEFNDPLAKEKRRIYGESLGEAHHSSLDVKSKITPHSARVSIVSQYITFLPPELIGRFFTGQQPAVVGHYAVLEPGQLDGTRAHQAMVMRELSLKGDAVGSIPKRYIKADEVNSNLSKSLRKDVPETLISHGCISIVLNEGPTSGLDVLRETRGVNAVANKTEICPYGNHCPPEIIRMLGEAHRCALCPYAVRSIDHLPAIQAERRRVIELIVGLSEKIQSAEEADDTSLTDPELDRLELERRRLSEEASAWEVITEVLEITRVKVAAGQHEKQWIVEKPEIIIQDLKKISAPTGMTAYLLSRMQECAAYPTTESPQIRARIELLRREILFKAGRPAEAFGKESPINPAAECTGLIRAIVAANRFSYGDLVTMLETNTHFQNLPAQPPKVFLLGDQ